jgi:small redox-active disulfide protein 2
VESATLLHTLRAASARGGIMEIKVLGTGCANCKRLYAEAERAVALSGRPATITKVEAIEDIVAYGVLRTPGLVIDEHVVASGRIPSAPEIVTMMTGSSSADD